MAVLIDTSVLVNVERERTALDDAIGERERAISVITVSELLHGVHRATEERVYVRRKAFVEHLLSALEPIPVDGRVARVHAELWARLDASGSRIGAHDLWIAATAVAHGYAVATANARDFSRVPGLDVAAVGPAR